MLAWLSLDTWFISLLSIVYLLLLFVVAHWGHNQSKELWQSRPWIYSLALGLSCSSWAFYGMVGQAATTGYWLAPVYIGSILCFTLAWPMLVKMLTICKQQNLTSIADFIACRYDRSQSVAALVALIALLGTIPYIALQLRAISKSFDLLTGSYQSGFGTVFTVTIVLIVFSILFGTRQITASKQNQGLMFAIAFSSIVKLFALTAVGIFTTYFIFDGFADLLNQQASFEVTANEQSIYLSLTHIILGAITIFSLPQLFHMMIIENHHKQELKAARWLYPLFLIAINLFILPIALAGQITFPGGSIDADTFVLSLPLYYQQAWLAVVVYIGGLAAASSMVIVATIVLSTMVATEIINPFLLRFRYKKRQNQAPLVLLNIRRIAIAIILLLAFIFERILNQQSHLASIGLLSFSLLAQFAPTTIGALYFRKATAKGALAGLLSGTLIWFYCLFLPTIFTEFSWLSTGPFQITWLKPTALFGLNTLDFMSHGVFYSLLINCVFFITTSLFSQPSLGEKLQAEVFLHKQHNPLEQQLTIKDLTSLLKRFVDNKTADNLLSYTNSSPQPSINEQIEFTRIQLSGVLGSASTRMVMKAAATSRHMTKEMPFEDVVSIVDEASQIFQFNRELLQAGVENIEQGMSVIDSDMRLVAWNRRYIELLDYPEDFVTAGKPVEELLRFNAERGVITGGRQATLINRRLEHMRQGHNHHFQRVMPNGIVLEIRGQAMPGGGFVSTFSDITAHIEVERQLQKANENLEKRVAERTNELLLAKAEAEAANRSKTRFLAAASHDLMQPFNALSLFTSLLKQKARGTELETITNNISDSLIATEALLSDLVEISKLEGGAQTVNESRFMLNDLLAPLAKEFAVIADSRHITFSYQTCFCWIKSDKNLLRRIVQNFLANAFNYCRHGRVVLGVRRQKNTVRIEVWDNGPGIPENKQQLIFMEFERLTQNQDQPGLGLGLAICQQISTLISAPITLKSTINKGSCFQVELPLVPEQEVTEHKKRQPEELSINQVTPNSTVNDPLTILVIDNDPLVLKAMASLLESWNYCVLCIADQDNYEKLYLSSDQAPIPVLIIADYHLSDNVTGVDLVEKILKEQQWQLPCIINSADPSEPVRQHTSDAEFSFIRKPIKPLALKRLMRQVIQSHWL